MNELFDHNGAYFSADRKYRYVLWRRWDDNKPMVCFIGLNPSKANETDPDPTIRRVIDFAKRWGYGGVYMLNLFAVVSADPAVLQTCEDPIGKNDEWVDEYAGRCAAIIFAWGNFKEAKERAKVVIAKYPGALCLKKNKNGTPIHPLYVKGDTVPIVYN